MAELVPYETKHFAALQRFFHEQFPNSLKGDEEFIRWRFQKNPLETTLPGLSYVVLQGEKVVGHLSLIPDRIWLEGRWQPCYWWVDLMIDPRFRNNGWGTLLTKTMMQQMPLLFVVGMGRASEPFFDQLGWERFHRADMYYSVFRPSGLIDVLDQAREVEYRNQYRWLRPMMPLVDSTFSMLRKGIGRNQPLRLHAIPHFDASFQPFIDRTLPMMPTTTYRSAEQLAWKFNMRPHGTHFGFRIFHDAIGTMRGYIVAKVLQRGDTRWVDIADYLVRPDDTDAFTLLLEAVQHEALRRKCAFVRFYASLPEHTVQLTAPRWIKRTRPIVDELFVYSRHQDLMRAVQKHPWHLTGIVSDRVDHGNDEIVV